jgi:xanthine dehydrogenase molybdopterin binding subunit
MDLNDSLIKHVTGESVFVNDIDAGSRLLYGFIVYSTKAHAVIRSCDTEKAKALPGVRAILSAMDIPGHNQIGPVVHDEPCLAEGEVSYIGQAILLIAADSWSIAREAASLIAIEYDLLPAVLSLHEAIEKGNRLHPSRKIECGNLESGFRNSDLILEGTLQTGSQEHWYLETQTCLAVPGEGKEMRIFSSTQHPSETQAIVAGVLGIQRNDVEVEVRRIGGAFGGKETQANHYAAWAALLAKATGRPVKIHLSRDEDQICTGKRHPFLSHYKVGFNREGKILAADLELNADSGYSTDLTMAILERAMFHSDNAYYIPNFRVTGNTWKTNHPSNTAFRGFGGPQGMAVIENIIDRIARFLGKDASEIRYLNFYKDQSENITHYGQKIENNRLGLIFDELMLSSEYRKRRESVDRYNRLNHFSKRGLALTPVKFGISFTTSFLNQAGALVNIFQDGTVQVNHGGTEMGQGLNAKILGIAASELGIDAKYINVNATNTSKVPNTSATAASSGADLNGMAVKDAVSRIKSRLQPVSEKLLGIKNPGARLVFENNVVFNIENPDLKIQFNEIVRMAYLGQVSLSATGFYKTPEIFYNKDAGKGKPFHYFAFGMAVSEVLVDTLTGSVKVLRTDILHDVGSSLDEKIDIGQIEGGFIQGLGWVTMEDLKYDDQGNLLNHSPDTYKIPTIRDIPEDFRVALLRNAPNANTIKQSKAVGEPPFMLALSVWLAVKDAVSAVGNHQYEPDFSLPATDEVILAAIEKIRREEKS